MDQPIMELSVHPARRVFALTTLVALGALLLVVAARFPGGAAGWQAFLVAMGVGSLWLAGRFHSATRLSLILYPDRLEDSSGRLLARIGDVRHVERGAFAFKPSNGFLLTLAEAGGRAWAPGLWWRVGRRVGVGGVTPAAPGRAMAEAIKMEIDKRG